MLLKKSVDYQKILHFCFQFDDGSMKEKDLKVGDNVTVVWNDTGHKRKITGLITNINIGTYTGIRTPYPPIGNSSEIISIVVDGSGEFSSNKVNIDVNMILNILSDGEVDPDEPFENIIFNKKNYKMFGISSLNERVITIPETYRFKGTNYRITGIEDGTFYNCNKVTVVELPETITAIGVNAFYGCTSLVKINIPNAIKIIDMYAFMECRQLDSIDLPNGIEVIGENCFYGVKNVNYIGKLIGAPWGAKLLNNLNVTDEVIDYSVQLHSRIYNPLKEGDVVIPGMIERSGKSYRITELGNDLFACAYNLTSVVIPSTVTSIAENCFLDCTGVESIDIPDSVVNIGANAFLNVANINYSGTALGAPWGAKLFNGEEYSKEKELRNFTLNHKNYLLADIKRSGDVVIPESFEMDGVEYLITEIADNTFYNCNALKSVVIPDSVTKIGKQAFANCSKLEVVSFKTLGKIARSLEPDTSCLEELGEQVFFNCISLRSIKLPDSLTFIGDGAFHNCINLPVINIPQDIRVIPNNCFDTCFSLTKVVMNRTLLEIGEKAFHNCKFLSIKIPDSVITIGEKAFFAVKDISYTGIAEGGPWGAEKWWEDIGMEPEEPNTPIDPEEPDNPDEEEPTPINLTLNKENLTDIVINVNGDITIPDTVEIDGKTYKIVKIANQTFKDIVNIHKVTIPDTVIEIGEESFYCCTNLQEVNMSKSVKTIGQHAFAYCTELESIVIPNGVTKINDNTFMMCLKLSSVIIPDTVKTICTEAFYGCKSIEALNVPDNVSVIGESAFYDVPSVYYNGQAAGYPWGADKVNDKLINIVPDEGEDNEPTDSDNKDETDSPAGEDKDPGTEDGDGEEIPPNTNDNEEKLPDIGQGEVEPEW